MKKPFSNRYRATSRSLLILALISLWLAPVSRAALQIDVTDTGSGLSWEVSGTLNLIGSNFFFMSSDFSQGASGFNQGVRGDYAEVEGAVDGLAPTFPVTFDTYIKTDFTLQGGSANWQGLETVGASGTNTFFVATSGDLGVPNGYVSGNPLNFTANTSGSFAAYNMNVGESRVWASAGNGDTITFTAVPEPSAAFLAWIPAWALLGTRRRSSSEVR